MPWLAWYGLGLVAISAIIFSVQIVIFNKVDETVFLFLQELAFSPIKFLLITLLIHRLLTLREKQATLTKLNMLIGIFFSEVGMDLVKKCFAFDRQTDALKKILLVDADWDQKRFRYAGKTLEKHILHIDIEKEALVELKSFLCGNRENLFMLMANPNLLEHDAFTRLMQAVFHLMEELEYRTDLTALPPADYAHLSVDIGRAYRLLVQEWLAYMCHLKAYYPYLFSLAMRNNPFNANASVVIKEDPAK